MSPISVSPSGPPDGIAPIAATPRSSRPRRTNQSDTQKSAHYRGRDQAAPARPVGDERARPRLRRPGGGSMRSLPRSARRDARRLDRREDRHPGQSADAAGRPSTAEQAEPTRARVHPQRHPNLFAALRVHTGEVSAMPAKTRNRFDLLRFLDQLDAEIPAGRQVIAISDNLST